MRATCSIDSRHAEGMAVHPPIVRRLLPPTEAERAERAVAAEHWRAEMEATRVALEPARRAAILAGPPLRDVDAAVACHCSCHPRPADPGHHEGGATCSCQLTPDERRQIRDDLFADLPDDGGYWGEVHDRLEADLTAEAVALGVEATLTATFAPFVITGTCDGRAFYLRERHGAYRVTMATDDDPTTDPWAAPATEPSVDVAGGDENELRGADGQLSAAVALRLAVDAVRTTLVRARCGHRPAAGPYCPDCGVALADAAAWRR